MELRNIIRAIVGKFLSEGINHSSDILYHGTDSAFSDFNDRLPIFFVDDIDIAKTYGNFVVKARLKMDNPIELDFDGGSTYYFFDKWYLPSELAIRIREIADDIKNRYIIDEDLKEYLESLGFNDMYGDLDSVIMKNISDSMGGIFSTHKPTNNYVVFDKNQISIISEGANKFAFDEEIRHELRRYLQDTVWNKVGGVNERADELLKLHSKFIDNVRDKMSAGEIAKRLFEYEKNILSRK